MNNKIALGIDIGNVIIEHRGRDPQGKDKLLYDNDYSRLFATVGAMVAIEKLNKYFNGNVCLISKLPESSEIKVVNWLKDNKFFEQTGMSKNVFFIRERKGKYNICERMGITHFIDDRLEVLSHMITTVPNLYLYNPDEEEVYESWIFREYVSICKDWNEIIKSIIK